MNTKALKNKIFEITNSMALGEREAQDLAFKVFIDYAYESMLITWHTINNFKHRTLRHECYFSGEWLFDNPKGINEQALQDSLKIYAQLISENGPFADILSTLTEEIILNGRKGNGRGQFFTPKDIADTLAELSFPDDAEIRSIGSVKRVGDICCGAGSLILSFLRKIHEVEPEKLKLIAVLMNDIDELACKSATLQVLASLTIFNLELNEVMACRSDAIKEYMKGGTLFFGLRMPASPYKAGNVEAFEKVSSACKSGSNRTRRAVSS